MSCVTEPRPDLPERGLLTLVDELLLAIIDQIDLRDTLCNLAATCSRFQALTEPYIWRNLSITNGDHSRKVATAFDLREARRSHVHELSIRYADHARRGIEQLNFSIGKMDKLRHLTIESPCPNNTEWTRGSYFDGWTRIDYRALLEGAIYHAPDSAPTLPILQSFTLHGHGPDDRKFLFGRCAVMFFHPTLRRITISCTNFHADITHATIPPVKKKSTPLQSLTLIECNVNVKFLDVVLSLPKALKELNVGERLHTFPECRPDCDWSTRTSHPLFVDALARQADSLERLSHISGNSHYLSFRRPDEVGISHLRDLTSLRYLELGAESTLWSYLEHNDYPDSLEMLKVTDAAWANNQTMTDQFLRHPGNVLKRCYDTVIKSMSRPIDVDICFSNQDSEYLLTTFPGLSHTAIIPSILGGPVRSPLYKLSSALKSRSSRLRIFASKFSSGRSYIPPYMLGEEEPSEVQFYDSEDYWKVSGVSFRAVDDEAFRMEVREKGMLVCHNCEVSEKECFNDGDGERCIQCVAESLVCIYRKENT